jgi:hypothetical protein
MPDIIDKRSSPLRVMPGDELSSSENRKDTIDRISHGSGIGTLSTAIGDNFYGINHRQTPAAIQINKDFFGLTFFTRPRLNLSSDNIRFNRKLAPLLSNKEDSLQRIIRCLLDPRLAKTGIKTQFVDNQQAFIPLLTNNLLSISGWNDIIAPTFTSEAGVYREDFSFVDGVTDLYATYDIVANFRNMPGDPITSLILHWVNYQALVFEGVLYPYPEFIKNNEIDYNTRIYRLVLDSTKTIVQKIAATGASFPVNAPIGAAFNYEAEKPINGSNDQISISFKSIGANYQDDILIDEFNRSTYLTNDLMSDKQRDKFFTKIPIEALGIFNNRGYPRIDPYTYELEWWVTNQEYKFFLPAYDQQTWVSGEDVNASRILVPKF